MSQMKSYDFKKVNVILDGNIITGYADGDDVIQFEPGDKTWEHHVGADGEECRSKVNNEMGKLVLKMAQYSASNALLTSLWLADKVSGSGVFAAAVIDKSGTSFHGSESAYIEGPPKAGYGKNPNDREWTIIFPGAKQLINGN